MELVTKEIRRHKRGEKELCTFTAEEDYNVPDGKEDAKRMILCDGRVQVKEILSEENHIRIRGEIGFHLLYEGEGIGHPLDFLEASLPFEEVAYPKEQEGIFAVTDTKAEFMATFIHSRKVRLKAAVEIELMAEQAVTEEILTDIDSSTPLYKKKKETELLKLCMQGRDTYRIKEEVILSGAKETIGRILWSDVASRKLDTKLGEDELVLTGELLLFCFYESLEGKLDWTEETISYQGKIECTGASQQMHAQVQAGLGEVVVEVEPDEDGEGRVLVVEGAIDLHMAIYEEETLEILEDVYSLEKHCCKERRPVSYEQLILQSTSRCKASERLSLPQLQGELLQICHTTGRIQVDEVKRQEGGALVEGAIQVGFLYVKNGEDASFGTWHGAVPFSHLIECRDMGEDVNYHLLGSLESLSAQLLSGDEVEIRASFGFSCLFQKEMTGEMISHMTLEPIDKKEIESRPGAIGYLVKEGEELWDLAKRYGATMEGICEVNGLSDNNLKVGDRILIFKENMGIL